MRFGVEFGGQVGKLAAAHAGTGRIAALCHEAGDDAVEDDAVVKAFLRELGDAFDMLRREVGAQADDDVAGRQRQGKGLFGHGVSPSNGLAPP